MADDPVERLFRAAAIQTNDGRTIRPINVAMLDSKAIATLIFADEDPTKGQLRRVAGATMFAMCERAQRGTATRCCLCRRPCSGPDIEPDAFGGIGLLFARPGDDAGFGVAVCRSCVEQHDGDLNSVAAAIFNLFYDHGGEPFAQEGRA